MIDLTPMQQDAADRIGAAIQARGAAFVPHGLAGTGITRAAKRILILA